MCALHEAPQWQGQLGTVRRWYEPHLQRLYDASQVRAADLEQLEQVAGGQKSRESFLSDLTLDPPNALGDEAGQPNLDDDFLILSTIHSAKGQKWDVVYVLNAVDGCIPSDMATGTREEIEEERRLLYVAMTRARDQLYVLLPHRFCTRGRPHGDNHVYAPRTRFISETLLPLFERQAQGSKETTDSFDSTPAVQVDVQARLKEMWR